MIGFFARVLVWAVFVGLFYYVVGHENSFLSSYFASAVSYIIADSYCTLVLKV